MKIYAGFVKKILLHFIACHVDVKYYAIIVLKKYLLVEFVKNAINIFAKLLELFNTLIIIYCNFFKTFILYYFKSDILIKKIND